MLSAETKGLVFVGEGKSNVWFSNRCLSDASELAISVQVGEEGVLTK